MGAYDVIHTLVHCRGICLITCTEKLLLLCGQGLDIAAVGALKILARRVDVIVYSHKGKVA